MARQLKRWESPRKEGRNSKGKGGTARQRQVRKQMQVLRQRLKGQSDGQNQSGQNQSGQNQSGQQKTSQQKRGEGQTSPLNF